MNIPGGKQTIDVSDVKAVLAALQSDYLTTGPRVEQFETAFAKAVDARFAVAVNSGTAALHAAMHAGGVGDSEVGCDDEVIVPAISFVATANAVLYQNAKPVFADVEPHTLRIDVADVQRKITSKTRAIVAMDYGGQPCDYAELRSIADQHGLMLIADACHSLGGSYGARPVGTLADFSCFSLHPVKQITSGEGGVITTDDQDCAAAMKTFRNHGIASNHRQREKQVTHQYAMESLGFNYRLTDLQCALGMSQLSKLHDFTRRRNEIAARYDDQLQDAPFASPLQTVAGIEHARHLYVVRWNSIATGVTRDEAFQQLRQSGIGANVHYQPIYQHPFYRRLILRGDLQAANCPVADEVYESILSLPIFPLMTDEQVDAVVQQLTAIASVTTVRRKVA